MGVMSASITSPQRLRDFGGEAHEYVVTLTDRQACALRYIAHERVIRCRDCRHHDQVTHSCLRLDGLAEGFMSYVFDDGFCAWAEQKEES